MAKDDIDSFLTDMKTLASILGHNDDVVMEKFKDVFPDKNIAAAHLARITLMICKPKPNNWCKSTAPTIPMTLIVLEHV